VPTDVTLLTDLGEIVAKVLAPRIEEVPEVAEVPEGEAEEGAAEAGAEPEAGGTGGASEAETGADREG